MKRRFLKYSVKARAKPLPTSVTRLKEDLLKYDFSNKLTEWARAVGVTILFARVSLAKDASTSPKVVTVGCSTTPKAAKPLSSWTSVSPLSWTYKVDAQQSIEVQVLPNDSVKRKAIVGSCVKARHQDTKSYTMGLRVHYHWGTEQHSTWAILPSHAFSTTEEWEQQRLIDEVSTNDNYKLLFCPSDPTCKEQCAICDGPPRSCLSCPGTGKQLEVISSGKDSIFRSLTSWADMDMSIAKLPTELKPPIATLSLGDLGPVLNDFSKHDFTEGMLDKMKAAYEQVLKAQEPLADEPIGAADAMELFDRPGSVFAFKKGMMTGWTWGTLAWINECNFAIKSEQTGRAISDSGDCGSIWFSMYPFSASQRVLMVVKVIDSIRKQFVPLGILHSESSNSTPNQPDVWFCYGNLYTMIFGSEEDPPTKGTIPLLVPTLTPEELNVSDVDNYTL
ncbi:hypothetical protein CSPX01_06181 [Colletotrichum filicis]|nr:hypothetical protein CSPX01_06181 [Colletotrichum filicis]